MESVLKLMTPVPHPCGRRKAPQSILTPQKMGVDMPQIREKEIKFHPRRVRGPSQAPSMHSCHTQFRLLASSSHPHHPSISSTRTRSTKFLSLPISSLSPCHCYSIGLFIGPIRAYIKHPLSICNQSTTSVCLCGNCLGIVYHFKSRPSR